MHTAVLVGVGVVLGVGLSLCMAIQLTLTLENLGATLRTRGPADTPLDEHMARCFVAMLVVPVSLNTVLALLYLYR